MKHLKDFDSHINEFKNWSSFKFKDVLDWFINTPMIRAVVLESGDMKTTFKIFSVLLMEKLNIKHRSTIPTNEEVKEAIKQLKDIPKLMPLCGLFLLPIPFMIESYLVIAFIVYKLTSGEVNMLPDKFDIVMDDLANTKLVKFFDKKKKKKEL